VKDARSDLDTVLDYAAAAARARMPTPEMASVLETALLGLAAHARRYQRAFFVELPLGICGGVRGETAPAVPIAAASGLLFLGLDTADDLTDGDLPAYWKGHSVADIQIVTLALLASLPQQIIDGLDAPGEIRARMQAAVARGILLMIAGQQRDVHTAGTSEVKGTSVESSVAAKSGEELALFASLAALFAGATSGQVEQYAAMGRALGTAAQLVSDCEDLFGAPHSKDLAAGTRTLPIALAIERLTGEARTGFVALLERARTDASAGAAVRQQLRDAGVLPPCVFYIEIHRQRALAALEAAAPREPYGARLRELIEWTKWPRAAAAAGR